MTDNRFWTALEMRVNCLGILQKYSKSLDSLWTSPALREDPINNEWLKDMKGLQKTGLMFGLPFYWSPRTVELVRAAAVSMPVWTLTRESLPEPHAFFWFDQPLPLPSVRGKDTALVAISYTSMTIIGTREGENGESLQIVKSVVSGESIDRTSILFWGRGEGAFNPVPYTSILINPGTTLNEAIADYKDSAILRSDFDEEAWQAYQMKIRYFACCLSFLEQKIVGSRPILTKVPRAVRRRTEELKDVEANVNVITLRAYEQRRKEGDSHPVEWTMRWLVRGHWRQQYYPTENIHKPKWIAPFVKGPSNKPLKVSPKAFQVVR